MLEGEVYQEEDKKVYDMGGFENQYDDEDEDDALSFCDLPIYNGGDDADKESTEYASSRSNNQSTSSSFDENDDDCFEFSFTSSSSSQSQQEKNIIIFCGKIIKPHRKEESPLPKINSNYYCKELQLLKGNNKCTRSSSTPKHKGMPEKKTCHARKNKKRSKWYMLMLGLVRIHQGGNMELKDIKKRQQSKRSRSRHSAAGSSEDIEMMKSGNNNNKAAGLLSLLRSFSCTRSPTDDVHYCKVKASLWYLQRLRVAH